MLNPTPEQILRNIEFTLAEIVEPAVRTTAARSALATIGHLLRHVVLRIEDGGGILQQDIFAARSLLEQLHSYCTSAGDADQAQAIAQLLTETEAASDSFTSLDRLSDRASVLRRGVQDALIHLQSVREQRAAEGDYQAARAAIRTYLSEQLAAEAQLVHPAFADKGPRR